MTVRKIRPLLAIAAVAALPLATATAAHANDTHEHDRTVRFSLDELNDSGSNGTATVTAPVRR